MLKACPTAPSEYQKSCKIRPVAALSKRVSLKNTRNWPSFLALAWCRSGRHTPAAFQVQVGPYFGVPITQEPAVRRAQFELPDRPALAAIDEQGREPAALAGKFLAPLSQRDQHRKHP